MGRLLYDSTAQYLIDNPKETLSEESVKLLEDAKYIAEITDKDIVICLDLNDRRYNKDLSTMVISEITDDRKISILMCRNELNYK
jgi:hypothetical protein